MDKRRRYNQRMALPAVTPPTLRGTTLMHVDVATFLRHTIPPARDAETPEDWAAASIKWTTVASEEVSDLASYVQRRGASNLGEVITTVQAFCSGMQKIHSDTVDSIDDFRAIYRGYLEQKQGLREDLQASMGPKLQARIEDMENIIYLYTCVADSYGKLVESCRRALKILSKLMKSLRQRLDERSALALAGALALSMATFWLTEVPWLGVLLGLAGVGLGSSVYSLLDRGWKS